MHVARVQAVPIHSPFRWFAISIIVALLGMATVPVATIHAQSDSAMSNTDAARVVPESALFFAHANLDQESTQVQLAAELIERAGFAEALGAQGVDESMTGIPAGAEVAVVVTSIPEASDLDVADVSLDPLAATEELENGGYAVLISSDDPQAAYDLLLADLESNVAISGGAVTTSEYNGVTITSYAPAADDDFTEPSSVALVGDYAVQAVRAEDIHPIIDAAAGVVPTLANNENFQSLTEMLPTERLALGFINGPAILASLQASSPDVLESVDDSSTQALDAWTAFSFSAEENGFRLETRSVSNGMPFEEIVPLDDSFLDNVSSDALVVVNGTNIDSTGIVTTIALFIASAVTGQGLMATPVPGTPVALDQDAVFAEAESLLGFNLKTDFVDHLVGEFGLAITVNGSAMDPESLPAVDALLFSEIDDPVAVQDAVSKISFIIGAAMGDAGTIETRDVNGSQVNVIDLSETGIADRVEFGVVDGKFVISIGSGLDDYLLGPETPISADPNFNAVMENLPDEYGTLAYVNMPIVLELVTGLSSSMGAGIEDADPSCGDYATQQEAQAAYDADQFANFLLDQDFDGEACEDFFGAPLATPEATGNPYPNVIGLGSVSTQEDGVNGTSTFLLIGDDEP